MQGGWFSACVVTTILLFAFVASYETRRNDKTQKDTIDRLAEVINAFQEPIVHQVFEQLLPVDTVRSMMGEDMNEITELPSTIQNRRRITQEDVDPDQKKLKDECDPSSIYVTFDYQLFICNGTNVTYIEYLEKSLVMNCTQTNKTMEACLCPLDKTGERCTSFRDYTCDVKLISPQRNCTMGDSPADALGGLRLDGDFPCLEFPQDQVSQRFTFNMSCYFDEQLSELQNYTSSLNTSLASNITATYHNHTFPVYDWSALPTYFEYFLTEYKYPSNKTFALTKPLKQPFEFQIINFYSLADKSRSQEFHMNSTSDYLGLSNFIFEVELDVGTKHRAGNRIYAEVGVFDAPGSTIDFERLFLDIKDLEDPTYFDYTDIVLAIVIPISIITVGLATVIIYCIYAKKKRSNEEFFNPDLNANKKKRE